MSGSEPAKGLGTVRSSHLPELLTRALSAAIMAAIAIGAVLAGSWFFLALVITGALITNWEWAKLTRGEGSDRLAIAQAIALIAVIIATAANRADVALGLLAVAVIGTLWAEKGQAHAAWAAAAPLYLGLPAIALIWLRSGPVYGLHAVLFLLLVGWMADTAAYIGGKLIGGPKLAPRISPKKTWAGLICGILAPGLLGYVLAWFLSPGQAMPLAVLGAGLALASQLGDLGESAVKRHFGVKDASGLIPGHGGLLDRIDGLLLAAPLAALIALRDIAHPGQGLLLW